MKTHRKTSYFWSVIGLLLIAPLCCYGQELNFVDLFTTEQAENVSCYRIPSIVTAPNGDLLAAIDERVHSCADVKSNGDINIVLRRSTDNGKSWSAIERIVDYPKGESASDPSMIVDKETGAIFLFYNYMNLKLEKDVYYFRLIKSIDNGRTWSSTEDITDQVSKPEWKNDFKFITSGRGTQTASGTLLHTLVNIQNGLHLIKSEDHGATWSLVDSPMIPADESKIIELKDGTWMVNSRVSKIGHRYLHTSTDGGATWSSQPDSSLVDPGCNASIIRYGEEGPLLFCNAHSATRRQNLTIRASYDEGKTWTAGRTIYEGSAAYSSITVLANGDIGVFFERDGYGKNTFVSFPLSWVVGKE